MSDMIILVEHCNQPPSNHTGPNEIQSNLIQANPTHTELMLQPSALQARRRLCSMDATGGAVYGLTGIS